MRVAHYVDAQSHLRRSGIGTAVDHQRRALAAQPVDVRTDGVTGRRLLALSKHRAIDVDLVHTNLFGPGSLALAAIARRQNLPLVCHAHVTREDFRDSFRGSNILARPLGAYLKRWYSLADLVLCPSEYTKSVLEGYPVAAPIEVISNGVDLQSLSGFEQFREPYRERYDLSGTVVFCVGNVFERKGLSTFCAVAKRCPDLEFVWFGPYDTGITASSTVNRLVRDPPENVTFTGWVPDKRGAFAAGDIFFFPTHVENQGIAILEAMACGRPVVVRDIPVVREYFSDGTDSLQADSIGGFVGAIETLADDDGLAADLGEGATHTAYEHRLERVGEQLYAHYEALLEANAQI